MAPGNAGGRVAADKLRDETTRRFAHEARSICCAGERLGMRRASCQGLALRRARSCAIPHLPYPRGAWQVVPWWLIAGHLPWMTIGSCQGQPKFVFRLRHNTTATKVGNAQAQAGA